MCSVRASGRFRGRVLVACSGAYFPPVAEMCGPLMGDGCTVSWDSSLVGLIVRWLFRRSISCSVGLLVVRLVVLFLVWPVGDNKFGECQTTRRIPQFMSMLLRVMIVSCEIVKFVGVNKLHNYYPLTSHQSPATHSVHKCKWWNFKSLRLNFVLFEAHLNLVHISAQL